MLQGIEGVIRLGFTSHRSNGLQISPPKFPHLPISECGIFLSSLVLGLFSPNYQGWKFPGSGPGSFQCTPKIKKNFP